MKAIKAVLNSRFCCVFASFTILILSISFDRTSANAQQTSYFICKNKQGIWTTVVNTKQGEKNFILWDSTYFVPSGYTPEVRCNQVTGRLNSFFDGTSEQYIGTGKMNNQPIICITNNDHVSCKKLLYTLKPDQDGEKAVTLLIEETESNFNETESNFNPPPLREGLCHSYLSLNALIEGKPKAKKICD